MSNVFDRVRLQQKVSECFLMKKRGMKAYLVWMAWRNLISRKRRAGPSFMTVVSIGGVSIGVAALIIVLSVMGGFEADIKDKLLRGEPHLEIVGDKAGAGFSLKEYPVEKFRSMLPGIKDIEPYVQAEVVVKQNRNMAPGMLYGVDPSRSEHLWGFGKAMLEGSFAELAKRHPLHELGEGLPKAEDPPPVEYPGILLGQDLAIQLGGVNTGELITLISPQSGISTALAGASATREFKVVGIFQTGLFSFDQKWAVVNLADGRKFMPEYDPSLDIDEFVTGVAVNVPEPFAVDEFAKKIHDLPGIQTLTWKKSNASLLFALKLEKFAMGSVLALILIVAAFSISGTMMMTVFHKRTEVSLLRSLGMTKADIARLFMLHGFTIGSAGIVIGLALGLGVCAALKNFQFLPLPPGVYYLKFLPVKFLPADYGVICLMAWLFSLIAATYPAVTAARQNPSMGLRHQ